jgi:hypothetical protein
MRTTYRKGSGESKQKTISLEGMEIPFDRETIQTLLREELHGLATELALRMAVGCLEDGDDHSGRAEGADAAATGPLYGRSG